MNVLSLNALINLSCLSGSIFLLVIAAVAKLKSRVRDVELTSEIVQRISQLMRNPHASECLQLSTSQAQYF